MIHHFNVSSQDRKNLVKAISEHLGMEAKYLGAPSFAYQVGTYTISKDGALSWSDLDDADPAHTEESCSLIQALEVAGFHSEEAAACSPKAARALRPQSRRKRGYRPISAAPPQHSRCCKQVFRL